MIPQALCAGSCQLGNAGLQPAKAHYLQPHHTPPASPWLPPACALPGAACLPAPHLQPAHPSLHHGKALRDPREAQPQADRPLSPANHSFHQELLEAY